MWFRKLLQAVEALSCAVKGTRMTRHTCATAESLCATTQVVLDTSEDPPCARSAKARVKLERLHGAWSTEPVHMSKVWCVLSRPTSLHKPVGGSAAKLLS